MATADLKPLTGLRGVAALWVAAYHLLLPGALIGGMAARIVGRGYLAVDLFFVLSGFLLALNYGGAFAAPARLAALPGFLWRRWSRIAPLYLLILGVRLAYTGWVYGGFHVARAWIAVPSARPWTDIPANLLLVQSWHVAPSLIGPAWSVSTELAAYFVFPLLAAVLLHGRPWLAIGGAACAAGLVLMATSSHGSLDVWDGRSWGPLQRCLGGFALGMGLWRLSIWPPARRIAAHPAAAWCMAAAIAAGLAGALPDLVLYLLLPGLVLCLACAQGGLGGLFSAKLSLWLGDISYALYLLHIFLLHPLDQARASMGLLAPPHIADAVAACLLLAFLLAASDLAYRWVENPSRSWLAGVPKAFCGRPTARRSSLTPIAPPPRNLPLPALRAALRLTDTMTSRNVR